MGDEKKCWVVFSSVITTSSGQRMPYEIDRIFLTEEEARNYSIKNRSSDLIFYVRDYPLGENLNVS